MKKQWTTLISLLFSCLHLFAQKGSWGEFPMVPTRSVGAQSASSGIKTGPAYEKALKVYERLREARGDFRYPVPEFAITMREGVVAEIDYIQPEKIYLSDKAFKVCESFNEQSEAAIAFLLGHELTHYYEKHAWRMNFAGQNQNLSIAKEMDQLSQEMAKEANSKSLRSKLMRMDTLSDLFEEVAMEVQSDYLGGFLAYSAGYGIFTRGDELIERLYKEFSIPDASQGYVTKAERQEMCRSSSVRMKDLVDVFEMANMLTAICRYEEAYLFYRSILVEYQSCEVYNNVGTTAVLQALNKYFTEKELKFRYPVQLDFQLANSKGPDEETARKKLLEQAILHFDAAISLDPGYAPAYLNKACALDLLGDRARAQYYADVEARKAAVGKYASQVSNIEVLLGILDAENGNDAKAKERWTAAAKSNNSLAAYNLAKLNNTPLPPAPEAPAGFFEDESIDGKSVASMLFPEEEKMMRLDARLTFHQNTKVGDHSRLYFNRMASGITSLFQVTNPDYPGKTSREIGLNATREEIVKAYGEAPRSILTTQGEIMAYADILFFLNGGKLARWALFKP